MRNTGAIPKNPIRWSLAVTEFLAQEPKLRIVNHRSPSPIIGDGDANVSLTSYGKRIATVWKTIETIGGGTVKPRRIILWLDDAAALADPPAPLKRLRARGLEIRFCRDYGAHKKYFPLVCEVFPDEPERTLVTADDDVFYPPNWLEELLAAHRPDGVTAFRARVRSDGPYRSWPNCTTTEPSERVFATGVSGVAYPPILLDALRDRGDKFTEVCPFADDFWLHFAAVATGVPIRQVRDTSVLWWAMPVKSAHGLWDGKGTANDAIAERTKEAWLGANSGLTPTEDAAG
jgi:hypothetical protein